MTELRLRLCLSASRRASSPAASFTPSVLRTSRPSHRPSFHTVRNFTPPVLSHRLSRKRPTPLPILHTSPSFTPPSQGTSCHRRRAHRSQMQTPRACPSVRLRRSNPRPANRPRCTCTCDAHAMHMHMHPANHDAHAARPPLCCASRSAAPSTSLGHPASALGDCGAHLGSPRLISAHLGSPRLTSAHLGSPARIDPVQATRPFLPYMESTGPRRRTRSASSDCSSPEGAPPPSICSPRPVRPICPSQHPPDASAGPQTPGWGPRHRGGAPGARPRPYCPPGRRPPLLLHARKQRRRGASLAPALTADALPHRCRCRRRSPWVLKADVEALVWAVSETHSGLEFLRDSTEFLEA